MIGGNEKAFTDRSSTGVTVQPSASAKRLSTVVTAFSSTSNKKSLQMAGFRPFVEFVGASLNPESHAKMSSDSQGRRGVDSLGGPPGHAIVAQPRFSPKISAVRAAL